MGEARIGHTGTLLDNGEVLVVGGDFGNFFTHRDSAELYDPITETWSFTGSMALPRAYGTATLLTNGKVLLAAGQPSVFDTASPFGNLPAHTNLSEIYDPLTGTWSSAGAMAKRRHLHAATRLSAAHGSKVLVSGGYDGNSPAGVGFSANLYDPGHELVGSYGILEYGETAPRVDVATGRQGDGGGRPKFGTRFRPRRT